MTERSDVANRYDGSLALTAIEAASIGVWHWDLRTDEMVCSARCRALFGVADDTKVTSRGFNALLHPEDRDRVEQDIRTALADRGSYDVEFRIMPPGGEMRWLRAIGSGRRDADGRVLAMDGVVLDIAERKAAEATIREGYARLTSIIETVPDALILIDERGIVEMFSPAAERLFGYGEAEVIGQNVRMLMPSPYREEHDRYMERYQRTGERRIIGIGRVVTGLRKNGSTFPVQLAVGEATFGERRVFTGFIRDLSERQEAERTVEL